MQLANFWQDVDIDWKKDRVYLPHTDLVQHGISEDDIAGKSSSEAWTKLMAFQTLRTRQLMLAGAPLVHALPGRMGWEIRFTVQGGLRILDRIDAVRGDVFRHRPKLGPWDWLVLASRSLTM